MIDSGADPNTESPTINDRANSRTDTSAKPRFIVSTLPPLGP